MPRLLILILLMPLMLFVSVGAKAHDDSNAPSYLKGGLIEAPFELPSAEVVPDLDQAILPTEYINSGNLALVNCTFELHNRTSHQPSKLSCRGPPALLIS